MKAEYDFSKGERGKYFYAESTLSIPIYLDTDVNEAMQALADRSGQEIQQLVNDMLRHNVHLIKSVDQVT